MRIFVVIITLFLVINSALSQSDTTGYLIVDKMPVFKDSTGLVTFHKYLNQNIDLSGIQENLISGRIIVQFCIDSVGNTTDIKIIKSLQEDFDKAVINAVKNSPKWIPGKKDGISVKVQYTLPMNFDFQ